MKFARSSSGEGADEDGAIEKTFTLWYNFVDNDEKGRN